MRLDAHQHFWKFDPYRDSWIDETMGVLKRDYLPSDLKPLLTTNSIDGCIAVQADQSEQETEFLLHLAEQFDFVKGVVGWVDLRDKNLEKRLEYYSQNQYFKGLRHIVQAEKQDFLLLKDFQNGISKLSRFDLTYDILIYPFQLNAAIELVKQFPKQQFIIDHIAKPEIRNQKISDWKIGIQLLAQNPNVACKISGLVTEADFTNFSPSDFTPYLDIVFECFGEDRILFGSDWPVCLVAATYQDVLLLIEEYTAGFSEEQNKKLFGGNAARIYKITE
ncbi:amidohydrolase family protein [Flavobacteriaceae bacterium]|mgnify:FL=1|jgi:L-fuconolactonase|nr:amidohydrolase family protein [Flavobacteriaceae bacterium]MDB2327880.1 amidohydrolase family protein [Flavobacteriaceae bacterium]